MTKEYTSTSAGSTQSLAIPLSISPSPSLSAHLGHGVEGRQRSLLLPPVHGVRPRGKCLPLQPAVGRAARLVAVDDVGGDGERREGDLGAAVRGLPPQLGDEGVEKPAGERVHCLNVVAKLREGALHAGDRGGEGEEG